MTSSSWLRSIEATQQANFPFAKRPRRYRQQPIALIEDAHKARVDARRQLQLLESQGACCSRRRVEELLNISDGLKQDLHCAL